MCDDISLEHDQGVNADKERTSGGATGAVWRCSIFAGRIDGKITLFTIQMLPSINARGLFPHLRGYNLFMYICGLQLTWISVSKFQNKADTG